MTPVWRDVQPPMALAALAYLILMVVSGAPPTHGNLIKASPDGVLELVPERIVAVDLDRGETTARFHRHDERWHDTASGRALGAADEKLLVRAVTFMHTAAPVRILPPEAIADVAAEIYGLDRPSISVRLFTLEGLVLAVHFGSRSPDGMLQYMRIEGAAETYLMSGFVGEAWDQLPEPVAGGARPNWEERVH